MRPPDLRTKRLRLVGADPDLARAMHAGGAELERQLGARVPAEWPPPLMDDGPMLYTATMLEGWPPATPWTIYAMIDDAGVLIGVVAYKGPPRQGRVDIGYSVLEAFQRRGYASEGAIELIARAFDDPAVDRVVSETLDGLTPSIRVIEKCGMRFVGRTIGHDPGDPEVLQYEVTRDTFRRSTSERP